MADMPKFDLFEAIYTQRAVRDVKPDPVPEELLFRMIEAATKAPSGGNSQPWAFVVVSDQALRDQFAVFARRQFAAMWERAVARMQPGDPPPFPRLKPMMDRFEAIPALVLVCAVRPEGSLPGNAQLQGSIFPAVQNLLLAARGLGLGAALTTIGAQYQDEVRALLGLPENVDLLVTVPVGFPNNERYGRTTRRPAAEVTHWNGWGNHKTFADAEPARPPGPVIHRM